MNTLGLLIAWGLAWLLVGEALHSHTLRRVLACVAFAAGWVLVAAAFLWHVKHGEP